MKELIRYLIENMYLDFQGEISLETVRGFLREDDSREARQLLSKIIEEKGHRRPPDHAGRLLERPHLDGSQRDGRSRAAANVRRKLTLLAVLAVWPAFAGCDQGSPAPSDELGPRPRVVWTYPPDNALKVSLVPAIRVQFDRFLAPASAVRQSICVQAATVGGPASNDQCTGGILAPLYDPVDRVVYWRLGAALLPHTRYNVRVLAPQTAQDAAGIRAFDGAPLEKEFSFAFTTGDASVPWTEPKRDIQFCSRTPLCPLPESRCAAPVPVSVPEGPYDYLRNGCTSGGTCHGGQGATRGPVGSVLRISDAPFGDVTEALRRLVDNAEVATETATGPDPKTPSRGALRPFGRNMPYIDAANPGNSFLLYKLILAMPPRCPFDPTEESAITDPSACTADGAHVAEGFRENYYGCKDIPDADVPPDPGGSCPSDAGVTPPTAPRGQKGDFIPPLVEPLVPPEEWRPPAHGEYERLRGRIRGSPMPYAGIAARQNVSAISAWIAAGAVVEPCPESRAGL